MSAFDLNATQLPYTHKIYKVFAMRQLTLLEKHHQIGATGKRLPLAGFGGHHFQRLAEISGLAHLIA